MDLLWHIKNYDWFDGYKDDKRYWKEAQDKLIHVLTLIQNEKNVDVLRDCLEQIPKKTGIKIRDEIVRRINTLTR